MFIVYPGPDDSLVTIEDPKTGKTETVPVKRARPKTAAIAAYSSQPGWMFNSFAV